MHRNVRIDALSVASTTETLANESRSLLLESASRLYNDLLRLPLEPGLLSIEATSDIPSSPLSVRVAAPRAVTAGGIRIEVLQPWPYPYRLVRVAARLPIEYESLGSSDWSAAVECIVGNVSLIATLDIPNEVAGDISSTHVSSCKLQTTVRASSIEPGYGRCVLIEVPVPAGIVLRPGALITLHVCIAGSPFTLCIPATGHIHSAKCNHTTGRDGAVWAASRAGDAAALEAALGAGGCTDESNEVGRRLPVYYTRSFILVL